MKSKEILIILTLFVVGIYFLILGTIEAAGFLKPMAVAVLLTLICIPFCRKLESWKLSRGLSALISVLFSLLVFISFFLIISAQVVDISKRWPEIKSKMQPRLEEVRHIISEKTGLDIKQSFAKLYSSGDEKATKEPGDEPDQSNETAEQPAQLSPEEIAINASNEIETIVMNFFGFISSAVLTLVYLFFLLLYRNKVKRSILKFFSKENGLEAEEVMRHCIELTLNFIVGRFILIVFLVIIYSIGLSLSGIDNAILISLIASVLSVVPFIGNIMGYGMSLVMVVFAGAELGGIIGVSLTFGIGQFVESYILEPYVVGSKVDVNPLVTIVLVILGGSIWGILGMILSIPIAGICKVIFDATPALRPLGYALGEEDIQGAGGNFLSRWGEKLWNKISK